ncbi:MAG: hypothetical protein LH609_21035 [Rudanella sp.]|nr:hypothetical protein [Rudanella sp.]
MFTKKHFLCALCFLLSGYGQAQTPSREVQPQLMAQNCKLTDYLSYYRAILEAERLVSEGQYEKALGIYQNSFSSYQAGFLRDYKIATQLAFYLGRTNQGFNLLKEGIAHGWDSKAMKNMKFFETIKVQSEWKNINSQYITFRGAYFRGLRPDVRREVQQMFRKDQRKAFRALICFTSKAQDRYAERVFAPHSERQLKQLNEIIEAQGYPGERLIGNTYWASVILSHHTSISVEYVKKDTLYPRIRDKLLKAVELGQMSPYEFARIDDWYLVVKSARQDKAYGYINQVQTNTEKQQADQLRARIGLSSVETVKKLTGIQQKTGLIFYLPKS